MTKNEFMSIVDEITNDDVKFCTSYLRRGDITYEDRDGVLVRYTVHKLNEENKKVTVVRLVTDKDTHKVIGQSTKDISFNLAKYLYRREPMIKLRMMGL